MPVLRTSVALLLCCSACGFGGDKAANGAAVSFSGDSASTIALGAGDVMITSTDGALVLAVLGDSVRMQLSDSLRNAVKRDLESEGKDSKLASTILKSVGTLVHSALGFVVRVHVDNIRDLRYEDGHLRFDVDNANINLDSGNGKANNALFSEDDARRFIEAVERRQQGSSSIAH